MVAEYGEPVRRKIGLEYNPTKIRRGVRMNEIAKQCVRVASNLKKIIEKEKPVVLTLQKSGKLTELGVFEALKQMGVAQPKSVAINFSRRDSLQTATLTDEQVKGLREKGLVNEKESYIELAEKPKDIKLEELSEHDNRHNAKRAEILHDYLIQHEDFYGLSKASHVVVLDDVSAPTESMNTEVIMRIALDKLCAKYKNKYSQHYLATAATPLFDEFAYERGLGDDKYGFGFRKDKGLSPVSENLMNLADQPAYLLIKKGDYDQSKNWWLVKTKTTVKRSELPEEEDIKSKLETTAKTFKQEVRKAVQDAVEKKSPQKTRAK